MPTLRYFCLLLLFGSTVQAEDITEIVFEYAPALESPVRFMPEVTLTSSDGQQSATVNAFWDGGTTWRARFRTTEPGNFRWEINSDSLTRNGEVTVTMVAPANAIRVATNATHLETVAGEPFFWLADTAWNGILKSTDEEWSRYLDARQSQGFNVIQFVSTSWRGGRATLENPPFEFVGERLVSADPESLRRMDAKITEMLERGMVASPIMLWALNADDPGEALTEADAIVVAKYLLARWGAYRVVWMLGGDGRYRDPARWERIGSAVFTDVARDGFMPPLVTTHPSGLSWVGDDFAESKWYDFHGYQSGHGDSTEHLHKHLSGPWTQFPFTGKPRPVINLEPNYETHPGYQSKQPHSAQHVRRAAYWSILLGPAAGVTYGHNAVWVWNHDDGEVAENHRFTVDAWSAGLDTPGIRSMTVMKQFFESGPWWELRHAPEALRSVADASTTSGKTAKVDVEATILAASTKDNSWTVIYTPVQQQVKVAEELLNSAKTLVWLDPATGVEHPATATQGVLIPPAGNHDWVLSIRR